MGFSPEPFSDQPAPEWKAAEKESFSLSFIFNKRNLETIDASVANNLKQILEAMEKQVGLDEDEVEGDNEPNSLLKAHDQAVERDIDELSEGETEWEPDDGLKKAQDQKEESDPKIDEEQKNSPANIDGDQIKEKSSVEYQEIISDKGQNFHHWFEFIFHRAREEGGGEGS